MEMAPCAIEGLVAEVAARKKEPLLDELLLATLHSLDRSFMQSSHHNLFVGEVLEQQCRYHALLASHQITEIDSFMGEPTFWIHQNVSFQPCSSNAINPWLRS